MATKNGSVIALNQPPVQVNNRTLVPLRFVSEALGAMVGWENATRSLSIEP